MYLKIAKKKGFEIKAFLVWFRESKYIEKDEEGNHKKEYVKTKYNRKLKPEEPKDKLVGVEIFFEGECPFLYFMQEEGLHIWENPEKAKKLKYVLNIEQCSYQKYKTPPQVHRKSFF